MSWPHKVLALWWLTVPPSGCGQDHVTHFRILHPLKYLVHCKVVVSKKQCKIDTLLHTTNRKYHMAYRFQFLCYFQRPWRSFACCRLFKCNSGTFVWHFTWFQLTQHVAWSLGDSWASLHIWHSWLGNRKDILFESQRFTFRTTGRSKPSYTTFTSTVGTKMSVAFTWQQLCTYPCHDDQS